MGKRSPAKLAIVPKPLKVDLGCGKHVRDGFIGVDILDFGQPIRTDLRQRWPWKDASVEEAHASHFIEHLTAPERVYFVNELYRVLKSDAKCTLIVPHWASSRAYGDLTHQWPPVSEFWFYYLDKTWRAENAPHHTDYICDFLVTWGYNMHAGLQVRNQEYQTHALQYWKEAAQDMVATMTARKS